MLISLYHLGLTLHTGAESPSPPPSGITLDATSDAVDANVSSLSWSHTVGAGANRILAVTSSAYGGAGLPQNPRVTGITFGGVALTKVLERYDTGVSIATSIWRLVNPTAGAGTIVVSYTGACERVAAGALSLAGVHQTTPVNASASSYFSIADDTLSITTTIDKCWTVNVYVSIKNASRFFVSWGVGQTQNWQHDANDGVQWFSSGSSRKPDVATGGVSHTVTLSGFVNGAHVLAAFAPA